MSEAIQAALVGMAAAQDLLAECAQWMDAQDKERNFDGLLAAWLDKLDTNKTANVLDAQPKSLHPR